MNTTASFASSNWSALAWRGFAGIVLGAVALAWPGITLAALTVLYGAYAFADGVLALVFASHREYRPHRWLLVLDGLFGIGAGVVTLLWPGVTLVVLVLLVGARAVVLGGLEIAAAIRLRKTITTPVLYGLAGILSIAFGVVTFVVPIASAFLLVTMLGVYAIVFGGVLLAFALRMRRAMHHPPATPVATH